jgi:hypothetical protein
MRREREVRCRCAGLKYSHGAISSSSVRCGVHRIDILTPSRAKWREGEVAKPRHGPVIELLHGMTSPCAMAHGHRPQSRESTHEQAG